MKSGLFDKLIIAGTVILSACTQSGTVFLTPDGKRIKDYNADSVAPAQIDTLVQIKEVVRRDTIFLRDTTALALLNKKPAADTITVAPPKEKRVPVRPAFNANDKYYLFDSNKATSLWKKWHTPNTELTQDDYFETIDLCGVAYDYFTDEYQKLIDSKLPAKTVKTKLQDLDLGKASVMMNFMTNLSISVTQSAKNGALDDENVEYLNEVLAKKKKFKEVRNQLPR